MSSEDIKILEFSQYQKSDKPPFTIYADLECFKKVGEHILSGFLIYTSFKSIESKHHVGRGKDFMKKFCESLREHTMKMINFEKKKMKLVTNEQQDYMKMQIFVIFVKENYKMNMLKIKNIQSQRPLSFYR